ncbi:hypothetical protein SCLCIDRAFT_26775 [Scleroderma citrinum Foug A]|uniref:Uncharacterized protein n=1 Tax=Scleroderma citrinum Foug A TaxID=1036808 RepID=A0A0C3DHV9_9AGAM|nr:hypothetical protein SCLCIDRAFT_26775 [Scleroderma citrinum Foug A]
MDSHETPSSPLEFHAPNKSLLAPPKNTFRTVKSLPDVTSPPPLLVPVELSSCPLPGSSNEGALAGRVSSSVVLHRKGEIRKPPPLLFRPTTFWRKTRRSGVTGASYSPSSFLVRRSTFVAAGLSQDTPGFDLSALGVESRVSFLILGPDYSV